jgi:acyl carrier protein
MDAVAHYRRGLGLPALTINWGPWAEAGMAAAPAVRNRLAARGLTAIDPREASALLSVLIRRDVGGQIGVLPVDWPRFLAPFGLDVPPLFDAFAAPAESASRVQLHERLQTVSVHERAALVRGCVASELAVVFGFASAADVGTDQTFFDLGMDSLMAIELRNRLQSALCTTLPATIAFDHPTVEALGEHLTVHLFPNLAPSRV